MATESTLKAVDLQDLISRAAKLEVKALMAGVEVMQVWIGQAAKLSMIASDALEAIDGGKGSLADTTSKLTEFGKQNAQVYVDLSSKLSHTYYSELGKFTAAANARVDTVTRAAKSAVRAATARTAGKPHAKAVTKALTKARTKRKAPAKASARVA